MNHKIGRLLSSVFLSAFSLATFSASQNPIGWQVSNPLPSSVVIGSTYLVTYTLTNAIPFQLRHPLNIIKSGSPTNEFTFTDNCTGQRLAPNATCTVEVSLAPRVAGTKTLQLTIAGYDNNSVPLPIQTSRATGHINGVNIQALTTQSITPAPLPVGTAGTFGFQFINNGTAAATGVSISVAPGAPLTTYSSTCTTTLLPNGGNCFVRGSFTPTSTTPSSQSVTATFSFNEGSPVSQSTSVQVTGAAGLIGSILTVTSGTPLPPVSIVNTAYQAWFLYTNNTDNTLTLSTPTVTPTITGAGSPGTYVIDPYPTSSCLNPAPNNILPKGASCTIKGTYTAPAAVPADPTVTLTASMAYTGGPGTSPSTVSTQTVIATSLPSSRVLTFKNECSFNVWASLNGGALPSPPAPASCTTDADCHVGSASNAKCNTSSHVCYFPNYPLSQYLLTNGQSATVTIPANESPDGVVQWSGNISASTLCSGSTCGQADCGNNGGTTNCAPGQGYSQPATQAEITMLLNNIDTYDVEVINGFHLPIQMAPEAPVLTNSYSCGTPGKQTASSPFGACAWNNAVPPTIAPNATQNPYYWVTSGPACNLDSPSSSSPNAACNSPSLCGLDASFTASCGNFLGYWSADQVCGSTGVPTDIRNRFHCDEPLPTATTPMFPAGSTLQQLMLCKVTTAGATNPLFNSCYLTYTGYTTNQIAQCCGCVDWWLNGVTTDTQSTSCGGQTDASWNNGVQPTLLWMKQACPTAYVYPFDDKTSTFTCTNNAANSPNTVNYKVTFCPGGDSGLPTGITEGR